MLGRKDVPVEGRIAAFDQYDIVLIGFPIWYGAAPNVVNTFCKSYQWNGKRVFAFATSGGSGIGRTAEKLAPHVKGAASVDAKLVHSAEEVKEWVRL
jgi:menaquinone-dependent protoporphyrinogen IX oxidase